MPSPLFQSCFTGLHSVSFYCPSLSCTYWSPSKMTTFFRCCTTQTFSLNDVTFPWACPLFWCLSCHQLLITLHPTDGCLQICIQAVTILERFNKYLFSYGWMVSPTGCLLWEAILIAAHHIQKSGGIFLKSLFRIFTSVNELIELLKRNI